MPASRRALFLTSQSAARLYQAPHNSIDHVLALAWPPLRDQELEPHAGLTSVGVNEPELGLCAPRQYRPRCDMSADLGCVGALGVASWLRWFGVGASTVLSVESRRDIDGVF